MASLLGKLAQLAASPQGRRLANQAKDFASKPENRAKIEQARQKLVSKGRRGPAGPAGGSGSPGAPDGG